jgi:lipoprotein NlpD
MSRGLLTILFATLIFGCASKPVNLPVINKSPDRVIPDAYAVKPGDSIYNIAWAYGIDFLDIAEWNELKKPYPVKPGQVLLLREQVVKATPLAQGTEEIQKEAIATALPAHEPASVSKPAATTTQSKTETVSFSSSPGKWNWPAEGKLVGKYSPSSGSNGIQIAGREGSAIKATAGGEVVYVGEGIRGYGKLVIVKHSPQFLSAYAHNRDILVKEGQSVKAGFQIASMGSSGAQSTMLHFEIRKDGKPVDPLQFLN